MARKSLRTTELEEGILSAYEIIDNTDQSRVGLSEGMDNIRELLADIYGVEFENDYAEQTGAEIDDEDSDFDSETDDESDEEA